MAEEDDDILRTDRWKEKSGFVPGLVFPDENGEGGTQVPELRFQVLNGNVYTLQVWPDGETARGQLTLAELESQLGESVTKEGWYDHTGKYLGSRANLSG